MNWIKVHHVGFIILIYWDASRQHIKFVSVLLIYEMFEIPQTQYWSNAKVVELKLVRLVEYMRVCVYVYIFFVPFLYLRTVAWPPPVGVFCQPDRRPTYAADTEEMQL
jgi:hypothetical protein